MSAKPSTYLNSENQPLFKVLKEVWPDRSDAKCIVVAQLASHSFEALFGKRGVLHSSTFAAASLVYNLSVMDILVVKIEILEHKPTEKEWYAILANPSVDLLYIDFIVEGGDTLFSWIQDNKNLVDAWEWHVTQRRRAIQESSISFNFGNIEKLPAQSVARSLIDSGLNIEVPSVALRVAWDEFGFDGDLDELPLQAVCESLGLNRVYADRGPDKFQTFSLKLSMHARLVRRVAQNISIDRVANNMVEFFLEGLGFPTIEKLAPLGVFSKHDTMKDQSRRICQWFFEGIKTINPEGFLEGAVINPDYNPKPSKWFKKQLFSVMRRLLYRHKIFRTDVNLYVCCIQKLFQKDYSELQLISSEFRAVWQRIISAPDGLLLLTKALSSMSKEELESAKPDLLIAFPFRHSNHKVVEAVLNDFSFQHEYYEKALIPLLYILNKLPPEIVMLEFEKALLYSGNVVPLLRAVSESCEHAKAFLNVLESSYDGKMPQVSGFSAVDLAIVQEGSSRDEHWQTAIAWCFINRRLIALYELGAGRSSQLIRDKRMAQGFSPVGSFCFMPTSAESTSASDEDSDESGSDHDFPGSPPSRG